MTPAEIIEKVKRFLSWRDSLPSQKRGGELMYDVPRCHKWLNQVEIYSYYFTVIETW